MAILEKNVGFLADEAKHALDALYRLETVDAKTIRRLGDIPKPALKSAATPLPKPIESSLPLGGRFREARDSFILAEPIHVLQLSQHVEKLLTSHGKKRIADLRKMEMADFLEVKGLGQGHIDEIVSKLASYLQGKLLEETPYVDFEAILSSLAVHIPPVRLAKMVSLFGLTELIPLTPAEKAELKRSGEPAEGDLAAARHFLKFALSEVAEVYLLPWMDFRGGIASKRELYERLRQLALDETHTMAILRFFEEEFSLSPLDELVFIREGLFASDVWAAKRLGRVIAHADSYLSASKEPYALDQLIQWILRDFSREWIGEDPLYVKRALRLYPHYELILAADSLKIQASQELQGRPS